MVSTSERMVSRPESLVSFAREQIETLIVSGALSGGQKLNEHALATRLNVSRGPIREAIRLLEKDNLVTSVQNYGVYVRTLDLDEATELYAFRGVVFGYICGDVAENPRPTVIRSLASLVEKMDETIEKAVPEKYFALNLKFHNAIVEASTVESAKRVYRSLAKQSSLFRRRSLSDVTEMRASNDEHRMILEAIRRADCPAARHAAELHHTNGKMRLLKVCKEQAVT
jgi:DNA-binding GntR family transcriptional regulator